MAFLYLDPAARRDDGIERVSMKADLLDEGWTDRAYSALLLYLAKFGAVPFIAEEVRAWAEDNRLISAPHDSRAWGQVMRRAAREKNIRKVGYKPAKSSNLSPKVLWAATGL